MNNFVIGKTLIALLASLTLNACSSRLGSDFDSLSHLKIGASRKDASNTLPYVYLAEYTFELPADTAMKATRIEVYAFHYDYRNSSTFRRGGGPFDLVALAFQNDRLVYWGLPDDFKRHTVPEISHLGEALSTALLKEL